MAYYLFQGRYSTDAIKAMVDNPQDRETAARALVEAAGGKMHSFFFCATTKLITSSEAQAAMSKANALKSSYKPATG
jgi:uncharacterized protein with GYD domain